MNINSHINDLVQYGLRKNLIQIEDYAYCINRLTALLHVDNNVNIISDNKDIKQVSIILNLILDYAYREGLFTPNTIKQRDLYESLIMDVFAPLPSNLNRIFYHLFNENPVKATNYLYKMSIDNNYIKMNRISKNTTWKSTTKYGNLDLTINLSKPEKDPRDIVAKSKDVTNKYPQCLLCKESVGFYGDGENPGRTNHRIIKINLNDEKFYFQYSPYVYYNEHSIILMHDHIPMNVSKKTFIRLLDFVDMFPHYFLGSNAGLPIVGGSILSHEHYQGGKHRFPIEDAKELFITTIDEVTMKKLIWPVSVIRLESANRDKIIEIATSLFNFWEQYNDIESNITSHTDVNHNAITPIARKKNNIYTLDIALRNNLTSTDLPLGIFHPHPEHHNIKKENIGLVEVMGLAVLPARLDNELKAVKNALKNNENLNINSAVHNEWLRELIERYKGDDIDTFINDQVGDKFVRSLEDSGVFKQTKNGQKSFDKFITMYLKKITK